MKSLKVMFSVEEKYFLDFRRGVLVVLSKLFEIQGVGVRVRAAKIVRLLVISLEIEKPFVLFEGIDVQRIRNCDLAVQLRALGTKMAEISLMIIRARFTLALLAADLDLSELMFAMGILALNKMVNKRHQDFDYSLAVAAGPVLHKMLAKDSLELLVVIDLLLLLTSAELVSLTTATTALVRSHHIVGRL